VTARKKRIRVLLADDHPVFRQGLIDAIKRAPDLELAADVDTGRRALNEIRRLKPDVAVLDMKMPELDGIDVMRAISRDGLGTQVLFLSAFLESNTVYGAVEAGARGYISKDCEPQMICDAIAAVSRGETVLGPETQVAIAEEIRLWMPATPNPLSQREREILLLTAEGQSASDIAAKLYLSPATVKTHLQRVYQKLGVSDRAAAVAEAMRKGLLE
jgi:two-component system, NarL family, nitrate/nitrite response regulator NarL